jgi:hypothetical protein
MLNSILDSKLKPINLLKGESNGTVALTRKDVHTLLCHMFMATIESRLNCEIVNFSYLYSSVPSWRPEVRF